MWREQEQLMLCPSVEMFCSSDGRLYLLPPAGRTQLVIDPPYGRPAYLALGSIASGTPVTQAIHETAADSRKALQSIISQLHDMEMLRTCRGPNDDGWSDQYDRQLRYFAQVGADPVSAQQHLAAARVLIIGLGGVGGGVAQALARAGVGYLLGLDHDIVAVENLPRQSLYVQSDVGRFKADAFEARIKDMSPGISAVGIPRRAATSEDIRSLIHAHNIGMVVGAADTPADRFAEELDAACFASGTPYITGGQRLPHVTVGPLCIPGRTACLACFTGPTHRRTDHVADELARARVTSDFIVPALGVADDLVAALIASDVISLVTGAGSPALSAAQVSIDLTSLQTQMRRAPCGSSCDTCRTR